MWLRVLIVVSATTQIWSQYTYANQKVQQDGTQFEWGWQLTPAQTQLPLDHFYVQTGPHIQYADNNGGLQSAVPPVDATAPNYNTVPYQLIQNPENTQTIEVASQAPLDVFLLQQQFPLPIEQTQNNLAGNSIQYTNIQTQQHNNPTKDTYNENPSNAKIATIVQVFKDHNCTNDDIKTDNEYERANKIDEKTTYEVNDNFRANDKTYKGAADFKIETRSNTRHEGYYYSTEIPTTKNYYDAGISRLVASTQDLINNDDLITINHSVEKQVYDIDDYIKPYSLRTGETRNKLNQQKQITLKAKIRNIENKAVTNSNSNNDASKFASPIVVQDSNYDYKEEILDTVVSTMTPFIQNGYVIKSITKNDSKNAYLPHFNQETVYVTPRPVGQKYLAPITVALRLLNSNDTDIFNNIEDHDASDSEVVEQTVPTKERTIVEVQESVPLDITHINEVEVHQYLEEGRSNEYPLNEDIYVHNRYNVEQFKGKHVKNEQVINEYGKKNDERSNEHRNFGDDLKNDKIKEKIESSENVEIPVTIEYNSYKENNPNNTNYDYTENMYGKRNNRKVIQPIVVEKEVPVPQYINRYIEKETYSDPKVINVRTDRPVIIPVAYEKIVEKPVEVTKYIDKLYPVQVPQPYPVPIKVPYPVEQKIYVDRPIHLPYPVEKVVEKEVVRNVPVPTHVAVPVKVQVPVEQPVFLPIPVERPYPELVEKPVEKIVEKEIRVPYPVEKKVLYPVPYEKVIHVPYLFEKPIEKIVEKPVHINVPVPIPVHIIKHYPVDRIVEKKVPVIFPIDRIVEKKVPYPVEKSTFFTKYIHPIENLHKAENNSEKNTYIQTYIDNYKTESQNLPQYFQNQSENEPNESESQSSNQFKELKDNEAQFAYSVPIQTTKWGSLYASSYKYIKPNQAKHNQIYNKYSTNNQNIYYGPPPLQNYNSFWENYNSGFKRFERQPKVTNVRLEYGFKPPLIPSTEVDLEGRPIHRD